MAAVIPVAIGEEAWHEVGASFEHFCLPAGIATLANMMEEDAARLCGPRYGRAAGAWRIKRAAGQARLRAELAKAALGELAAMLEFLGLPDALRVVPFVLINGEVGIGRAVDGVPVVDLVSLQNYFYDGRLGMAGDADGHSHVRVGYYWNAAEAERNLPLYLEETPAVSLRRAHLREAVYRNADPVFEGLEIVEYGMRVEISESEEGSLQAAKDVKASWNRRIGARPAAQVGALGPEAIELRQGERPSEALAPSVATNGND